MQPRPTASESSMSTCDSSFYSEAIILESLDIANALKLNDEELTTGCYNLRPSRRQPSSSTNYKRDTTFGLSQLPGARKAILFNGTSFADGAAENVIVKDTVSAGDAFAAAMALGWLRTTA